MSQFTLEHLKKSVLPSRNTGYFDKGDWRIFWDEAWKWMKGQSNKFDEEQIRKNGVGFRGEIHRGKGEAETAPFVEWMEPQIAGFIVDYFFDYMREVHGLRACWRKAAQSSNGGRPSKIQRYKKYCEEHGYQQTLDILDKDLENRSIGRATYFRAKKLLTSKEMMRGR